MEQGKSEDDKKEDSKNEKKTEAERKPWQTETEIQTWNGKDSQPEHIFCRKHFIWFPHLWSHGCDMWIRGCFQVYLKKIQKKTLANYMQFFIVFTEFFSQ